MNETPDSSTDTRIYLAAERTFLAWIRTGIAFMGFGFVVVRFGLFLREIAASNNMTVGIALIVAGIIVNLIAAIRHHRYIKALGSQRRGGALAMKTYGHLRNEHSQAMAQKVKF